MGRSLLMLALAAMVASTLVFAAAGGWGFGSSGGEPVVVLRDEPASVVPEVVVESRPLQPGEAVEVGTISNKKSTAPRPRVRIYRQRVAAPKPAKIAHREGEVTPRAVAPAPRVERAPVAVAAKAGEEPAKKPRRLRIRIRKEPPPKSAEDAEQREIEENREWRKRIFEKWRQEEEEERRRRARDDD